ncbi:hypothetical protein L596_026910 [Steinernema carpocapsae]|uniref:glucuronosyltransferase n=1 Tax=Steinernema carpocapsae TaxID=34508 RepID=A0A4V5ZYB2_STECR|nr:hypothetical protein L596_026910 [Steinernema carpocapsae]
MYNPRFGISHVNFMGRLADILVEEGIDVTVFLPKMNPKVVNNGTKLAKTVTIEGAPSINEFFKNEAFLAHTWVSQSMNPFEQKALMDMVTKIHAEQCEFTLQQKDVMEQLKKEKFDLGISEIFDLCAMGIYEEIGIEKHVLFGGMIWEKIADMFGAPNLPASVPGLFNDVDNKMGLLGRAGNLLKVEFSKWWLNSMKTGGEQAAERALGRKIDFDEKLAQASFVITNADPLLDFPRPITEKFVNIGGLCVPKPKPLDAYWEKVVTERKATVLLSFGSVAQSFSMPEEMKKAILETFKRFPEVTFIWKYEKDEDEVAKGYPNVVTNKWVPQNDLLNHPNLKVFITHAGMNSIGEVSRRGVPVITIPLFGDQQRNAAQVKRLGTAVVMDKADLFISGNFEAKIREVLENPSYRTKAVRLSQMMAKWPKNQREQFVKYVQFAGEFGHLPEYSIPKVSFVQYYMLDIFVPFLVVIVFVLASVPYLIYKYLAKVVARKVKTA